MPFVTQGLGTVVDFSKLFLHGHGVFEWLSLVGAAVVSVDHKH